MLFDGCIGPSTKTNEHGICDQGEARSKKLVLQRQKYGNFSQEERHKYIDKVVEARKRRKLLDIPANSAKQGQKEKAKTVWLLSALFNGFESGGEILHDPVCSELHELEPMDSCCHCGAKKYHYEPPTFCCDNGKIKPANAEIPPELLHLFTDYRSAEAIHFRKNARVYNNIFSFTSFGAKIDKDLASSTQGIYTFKVLGQVYQSLPGLVPNEAGPSHFQLYFWDIDNELRNRMGILDNADLNEDTMKKLMKIMEKNPVAEDK